MIKLTKKDRELFEANGLTPEDIGQQIKEYRSQNISDDEIQSKLNAKISEFQGNTQQAQAEPTTETAPLTLQGNVVVNQKFDPKLIANDPNLSREEKIQRLRENQNNIDKQYDFKMKHPLLSNPGEVGRVALGGTIAGASMLPIFNIPYVGTGLGGAMFNLGDSIIKGEKAGDILNNMKNGFILGETVGAIPYAGKLAGKMPVVKNVVDFAGRKAITPLMNSKPVQKTIEVLGKDVTPWGSFENIANIAPTISQKLTPLKEGVADIAEAIPSKILGLNKGTIRQAIRPGSEALNLDEQAAQKLLTETTQGVRQNYADLLDKKGRQVGELLNKLPEEAIFPKENLYDDMNTIIGQNSLSRNPALNPTINASKKQLGEIKDLYDNTIFEDAVSPQELYDINQNIGKNMIDWADKSEKAKLRNHMLQQVYGNNADKISSLSPALRAANNEYSALMDFKQNDGINQILRGDLWEGGKLGTAPTALRNYNSAVTKGNVNNNVQGLEKKLVSNGYEPFLNKVDDINAAMDFNNSIKTGFNPLGLGDIVKNIAFKPVLGGVRNTRWLGEVTGLNNGRQYLPASVTTGIINSILNREEGQ